MAAERLWQRRVAANLSISIRRTAPSQSPTSTSIEPKAAAGKMPPSAATSVEENRRDAGGWDARALAQDAEHSDRLCTRDWRPPIGRRRAGQTELRGRGRKAESALPTRHAARFQAGLQPHRNIFHQAGETAFQQAVAFRASAAAGAPKAFGGVQEPTAGAGASADPSLPVGDRRGSRHRREPSLEYLRYLLFQSSQKSLPKKNSLPQAQQFGHRAAELEESNQGTGRPLADLRVPV